MKGGEGIPVRRLCFNFLNGQRARVDRLNSKLGGGFIADRELFQLFTAEHRQAGFEFLPPAAWPVWL